VSLYRQLAAARPGPCTPDLVRSLDSLSKRLADLGRLEDAVATGRQVVDLYCRLHAARPEIFRNDRINALGNLAVTCAPCTRTTKRSRSSEGSQR
jgi:hypothetical protein